jgi:hypothetical protein
MPGWLRAAAQHRALMAYYALTRCARRRGGRCVQILRLTCVAACVRRSTMLALPMAAVTLLLNRELGLAVREPHVAVHAAPCVCPETRVHARASSAEPHAGHGRSTRSA